MSRRSKFESILGENWVTGRYLLPQLDSIGSDEEGVVLDLGSGESPFGHFFPRAVSYIRIDRSISDANVLPADIRRLPLKDNSVDTALLFQVITDVPEVRTVLAELRRVLRPSGRVLVFESMAYPEHDLPHDYYRLLPAGLEYHAMAEGFRVIYFVRLGGLFTRFASLWNTFLMGRLKCIRLIQPAATLGIVLSNIVCYALDRAMPHPRLAQDYLALLKLNHQPQHSAKVPAHGTAVKHGLCDKNERPLPRIRQASAVVDRDYSARLSLACGTAFVLPASFDATCSESQRRTKVAPAVIRSTGLLA